MEYVGGGSVSSLLRNPDCGPVRGEVREDKVTHGHPQATYTSRDQTIMSHDQTIMSHDQTVCRPLLL